MEFNLLEQGLEEKKQRLSFIAQGNKGFIHRVLLF